MIPADHTTRTSFPSGEEHRINIWESPSWGDVQGLLEALESSQVPLHLWQTESQRALLPAGVDSGSPPVALYDSYAVMLRTCPDIGMSAVTLWTSSPVELTQNSFVLPMRPEWLCRGGEPFPPFIGEDHAFRSSDGAVFLWHSAEEFRSWITRKKYALQP